MSHPRERRPYPPRREPTAEALMRDVFPTEPARASTSRRVVITRLSRMTFRISGVQRLKMEAPARLMTASWPARRSCHGPDCVGSPSTTMVPPGRRLFPTADRVTRVTSCPVRATFRQDSPYEPGPSRQEDFHVSPLPGPCRAPAFLPRCFPVPRLPVRRAWVSRGTSPSAGQGPFGKLRDARANQSVVFKNKSADASFNSGSRQ